MKDEKVPFEDAMTISVKEQIVAHDMHMQNQQEKYIILMRKMVTIQF